MKSLQRPDKYTANHRIYIISINIDFKSSLIYGYYLTGYIQERKKEAK